MAMADYRLCDVCMSKAFYDANLSYQSTTDPEEMIRGWNGVKLHWLGDWAVLCRECAKTHKCEIVKIERAEAAPPTASTPDGDGTNEQKEIEQEQEEGIRDEEWVWDGCQCAHTQRPPCYFCENATEKEFESWQERYDRKVRRGSDRERYGPQKGHGTHCFRGAASDRSWCYGRAARGDLVRQ